MRTSGEVLKDFEKLRKSLFDEEISHLAFIRDGKVQILYTQKYVDKLEQKLQQKENIIKEAREYIMTELITEWDIKNDGYVSGSDLPAYAITPILEILDKENKDV